MSVKITMLLTEKDVENANTIYAATQSRTKAQAVSIALSITKFLIEERIKGSELILRTQKGEIDRIVMPELENLNPAEQIEEKLKKVRAR